MVWLLGDRGMLGREVAEALRDRGIAFRGTASDLDIRCEEAVERFVHEYAPSWIVNCAAYTAVDRAEEEEDEAFAVNAVGPRNLARAAAEANARKAVSDTGGSGRPACRVIHVSTDYVFDGSATKPIDECSPVAALGAYGRTKAAGEAALADACPEYFIVRTAWLYGLNGSSFVGKMLRLLKERDHVDVVSDQIGSPTYAGDLARALVDLVQRDSTHYGVYHFANTGQATWFTFAQEIRKQAYALAILPSWSDIRPVSTADYPTRAPRPAYSVLASSRIQEELERSIPEWRDGLARFLDRYKRKEQES